MRTLLFLGAVVGVFALLGRRGRPGRSTFEVELQEAAREGVNSAGAILGDALAGAGQAWDETVSSTGAPWYLGGGKGAAVLEPRASRNGLPSELFRSGEPDATATLALTQR